MSSIQSVREFISERLNVAAVEIFTVMERTLVRYEERTERRQEMTGRPRGRFHGAEKPQPHVCKEEQLWNQENPEEEELKQESERGSEHSEELLSHNSVRSFINVRLSAAAVEIFSVFEQTMVQYEEQLDPTETAPIQPRAAENPQHVCKEEQLRNQETSSSPDQEPIIVWSGSQCSLPDNIWNPQIKLHRIEEQLWNQETSSSPDQENPEAPGCKEEEEELKQESDPFVEPPAGEEGDCRAAEADTDDQLTAAEDNKLPVLEPIIVWSGSQCSLPDNIWNPQIKLHRIDCPQQHVCKENRLYNQERTSSLCQEEPAPPQIEEEQEEADDSILSSRGDESDHSEAQSEVIAQKKKQDSIHKDEKLYSCSECHKRFRWKSHLIIHKRTHKGKKPYSCSECGKTYRLRSQLNEHKRTHTGEKPYSCSECGKTYRLRSQLIEHKQTHTGEKPYSCSECGKTYRLRSQLIEHKRPLTGEIPYCSECFRSFSHHSSLSRHMLTHTDEKPYSCSECFRSFRLNSHLIRHKLSHTGEKPYSCSECFGSFRLKSHLIRHKLTHTGEKLYSCSECSDSFRCENSLIEHQRIHIIEKLKKSQSAAELINSFFE